MLEAINSNDTRALLVALQARAARSVMSAKCSPRDATTLLRQVADFQRQIDEFDAAAKAQEVEDADDVDDEDFDPSTV
jgi:Holliday junction resolvasome RuvABC ATP-dependent DNA helicase subunit